MPFAIPRLAFVLAALLGAADVSHAAPNARFDWSVPARFAVPARGASASPYEIYVDGALHPDTWTVDFDACASTDAVAYRWTIAGAPAGDTTHCDSFSWAFPSEGRYAVSLTVVDATGSEATTARWVVVQDLLIFGLGDSYGSGEGAPDEHVPLSAITLANAKQVAADTALAARDAAVAAYLDALSAYQITQAQLNAVASAVARLQNARAAMNATCPFPVIACAEATAAEAAAGGALLVELGRVGLAAIGIDQPLSILQAVANLRALANAALDFAQASWDAAEAALSAAGEELAAARAELLAGWQDRSCHRSALAAQVQAARRLEERDPHTSVTFVHLACSGATIWEGILGAYAGIEAAAPAHPPQLDVVAQLASIDSDQPGLGLRRAVDAVLLSIGGNDVNFAGIIEKCILFADCPDTPVLDATALAARTAWCSAAPLWSRSECFAALAPPGAEAGIDAEELFREGDPAKPHPNGLAQLPSSYGAIETRLTQLGLGNAPVLLTQYPDITRDEHAAVCGWQGTDDLATRQSNLLGISPEEMAWAANEVVLPLSDTMELSAGVLGWNFVEGAAAGFRNHGYCSQQAWIVRMQESFLVQGQPWGMVHPNATGHAAWAEWIQMAVPEPGAPAGSVLALAALASLAVRRRCASAAPR